MQRSTRWAYRKDDYDVDDDDDGGDFKKNPQILLLYVLHRGNVYMANGGE